MAPSDFLDNLNGISLLAYIHKSKIVTQDLPRSRLSISYPSRL